MKTIKMSAQNLRIVNHASLMACTDRSEPGRPLHTHHRMEIGLGGVSLDDCSYDSLVDFFGGLAVDATGREWEARAYDDSGWYGTATRVDWVPRDAPKMRTYEEAYLLLRREWSGGGR